MFKVFYSIKLKQCLQFWFLFNSAPAATLSSSSLTGAGWLVDCWWKWAKPNPPPNRDLKKRNKAHFTMQEPLKPNFLRSHGALLVSKHLIFCQFALRDTDTRPEQKKKGLRDRIKKPFMKMTDFVGLLGSREAPTKLGLSFLSPLSFPGLRVQICTDECWVGSLKYGILRQATWIELAYLQLIRDVYNDSALLISPNSSHSDGLRQHMEGKLLTYQAAMQVLLTLHN